MSLLLKSSTPSGTVQILDKIKDGLFRPSRIRCPQCHWQPQPSNRWMCVECGAPEHFSPGCGESWNTFETFGECPGCAHQWQWTACLACGQWSQHDDWYEEDGEPAD